MSIHGEKPIADYDLVALRDLRDQLAKGGLARKTIHNYFQVVKSALIWGEENGMVPQKVLESARLFQLPRRGPGSGRITPKVKPVPDEVIDKLIKGMKPKHQDYFSLLNLTGARPGEIAGLALSEIDRSRAVWRYSPDSHKNSHRGQPRTIMIGPKAQAVLLRQKRERPFMCSCDLKHSVNTWGSRFKKECELAGVTRYHSHQIRHSVATRIAKSHGVEGARVLLGHSVGNAITSIYAERDLELAEKIALEIG